MSMETGVINRESFYVPDTPFNREYYPTHIGRHLAKDGIPSYAQVRPSILPSTEYLEAEQNVVIAQACIKVKHIVEGTRKIHD